MKNRKKRMMAYEASVKTEEGVEEAPKAPEPKTDSKPKKKKSLFGKG